MARASVLLACLALAGCGGTGAAASHSPAPPQPSAQAYLDQVSRIDQTVGDERSRFFAVDHPRAAVLREARRLGHDLTAAAARLRALRRPGRLARLHAELLRNYTTTGARVVRELARPHPRLPRVTDWLAGESDAEGRLIGDMYAAG